MPAFKVFPLTPHVTPIPRERLRFRVNSRSRPRVAHLIDLEECGFNGACGCEDFQMRHLPKLREDRDTGKRIVTRHCRHLKLAWRFFADVQARLLSANLSLKPNGHKKP